MIIKLLDVFAGIGGFHIGVKQACNELNIDFECVGAIEFNKHSQKTYRENFPNTSLLGMDVNGDITKMDLTTLPNHNLLCGGFPCQPFSQSGNAHINNGGQLINADDKTHLYQYLINILFLYKPNYFVFENVEGLTRIKYGKIKLLDHILTLIPKDYKVNIVCLSPNDIGIPQIRKRIFIVGCKTKTIANNIKKKKCPELSAILEDNVNESYFLEELWHNLFLKKNINKTKLSALLENLYFRNKKYPNASLYPSNKTVLASEINGDTPGGRSRQRDRAYHINGICPTLNCTDRKIIFINNRFRALTPKECSKLQGFPNNFIINKKDSIAYTQFGNAVCVSVVKEIVKCFLN